MSKLSLGEEANIQAARVRRPWNAVSLYYKNFETDRSKVKSLQWQLLTTNKKRKLGEGLFTEEPELEEPGPKDAEHYLERLYTFMLAYALAGSSPLAGAPAAKDEDVMLGHHTVC
eukprot:s3731_g8.t1